MTGSRTSRLQKRARPGPAPQRSPAPRGRRARRPLPAASAPWARSPRGRVHCGQARARPPSDIILVHICFRRKGPAAAVVATQVHARPEQRFRITSVYHQPAKMNMVKRIMGRPRQEECSPQDNALGLMHLRRLFTELCHPPRHMTQKEQEEKLYMMLPVFNRVFGNAPPNTMTEKFSDLLQFTTQVSRLMVTEIRRRASNKSTEAASRAIVQFLEINQSEEASRGWMLLTTINLLASSGQVSSLLSCVIAQPLCF